MEPEEMIAEMAKQDACAWEVLSQLTDLLASRTLAHAERLEELTEDVAGLGTRVSQLEGQRRNENSLRVVGREHFRTLDELAAVLRAELASEVAGIDRRITEVHSRALRALTALTEKEPTA